MISRAAVAGMVAVWIGACRSPPTAKTPAGVATSAPTVTTPTGSEIPSTFGTTTGATTPAPDRCTPIDLTTAAEVEELIRALTGGFGMPDATDDLISAYRYGDGVCPAWSGIDPAQYQVNGTTTYTGGCATSEYAFTGTLAVESASDGWDPGSYTWLAESGDWEVSGSGRYSFEDLKLVGSLTRTSAWNGVSFVLDGTMLALRGSRDPASPLDASFPAGVTGTLSLSEGYTNASLWMEAALEVACRSELSVLFDWTTNANLDDGHTAVQFLGGVASLEAAGHEAALDLDFDQTPDGCVSWSLDGVPQPDSICAW